MGGQVGQRHHMKAILFSAGFIVICIMFVMWLKDEAQKKPVPTNKAIEDIKSTDWKKFGTDHEGDHYYRFDDSSKAFPDVLSVKTKIVYSESGKKSYIQKRMKNSLPVQGFESLDTRTVLYGLNCVSKNRELVVLEVFELTKDGQTLDYARTGSYKNWAHIPPGSVYDELATIVCPSAK
ncbi:MAG: hypothetical protein ABFD12_07300 [Syntrophorhabdus sp.]